MLNIIKSGGIDIAILEKEKIRIGMPISSLDEHIKKHPDVASKREEYLEKAAEVIYNGKKYKNGYLYKGMFAALYESEEVNCYILTTLHKRFRNKQKEAFKQYFQ